MVQIQAPDLLYRFCSNSLATYAESHCPRCPHDGNHPPIGDCGDDIAAAVPGYPAHHHRYPSFRRASDEARYATTTSCLKLFCDSTYFPYVRA